MKLRTVIGRIASEWRKLLAWLALSTLFSMVLPLSIPLVERYVINSLEVGVSVSPWIWLLIVLLLPWRMMRLFNEFLRWSLHARYVVSAETALRHAVLQQIFFRSPLGVLSHSSGDIVNRIRDDVHTVIRMVVLLMNLSLRALIIFGAVFVLLKINAKLTLTMFFPFAFIFLLMRASTPTVEKLYTAARESTGNVSSLTGDIFNVIQAVQIAQAQPHVLARFAQINQKRKETAIRDGLFRDALGAILYILHQLAIGVTLILAIGEIRSGTLTVGDLFVFFGYYQWIVSFSSEMGQLLIFGTQARVSWQRLSELYPHTGELDTMPRYVSLHGPLPEVTAPPRGAREKLRSLELRNVASHYADSGKGISGLDLHLEPGSLIVLSGRMGAGKTTALRTLLGLLPMQEGEIIWNGQRVEAPEQFFCPPICSYTAQVPSLLSDTIRHNISLGRPLGSEELEAVIRLAGLEPDLLLLEKGLDTVVGPRGVKLSGGQVQRIAAARMMATRSELWVFDDISSALDVETEKRLWDDLQGHNRQTCLLVSNKREALRRADEILVLEDGRVEARGTWEKLLAESREFAHIWYSQGAAIPAGAERDLPGAGTHTIR